jgi:hypothetical protein
MCVGLARGREHHDSWVRRRAKISWDGTMEFVGKIERPGPVSACGSPVPQFSLTPKGGQLNGQTTLLFEFFFSGC